MQLKNLKLSDLPKPKQSLLDLVKVWVFPVVTLLVFTITVYQVLLPWYQDIQNKRAALKEQSAQLEPLRNKFSVLQAQETKQLQKYLATLNSALPSSASAPRLLVTAESLLNQSGLQNSGVRYSAGAAGDKKKTTGTAQGGSLGLSFTASGEIPQIINLLEIISQTRPLISTDSLQLRFASSSETTQSITNPENPEQTTGSVSVIYQGTAPYQALPKNVGKVSSEVKTLSKADLKLIEQLDSYTSYLPTAPSTPQPTLPVGKDNPFQ